MKIFLRDSRYTEVQPTKIYKVHITTIVLTIMVNKRN